MPTGPTTHAWMTESSLDGSREPRHYVEPTWPDPAGREQDVDTAV